MDFFKNFEKYPSSLILIIGCVITALLGITDYKTGYQISFSIFYLIPITFVTLFSRKSYGIFISSVSAIVWLIADIFVEFHYDHWLIPYWNATMRFGYFIIHTFLLSHLKILLKKEKELSRHDPLTGAANWRYFTEVASRELEIARRTRRIITFSYLDMDNFKKVNDTFGHEAGDDVLRTVVRVVQSSIRPADLLARVGGDEFVLFFPETDFDGANKVLIRLREELLSELSRYGKDLGLSIGAVSFSVPPQSIEAMMKKADTLMYSVKKSGKNNLKHIKWPDIQETDKELKSGE